MKYAFEMGSGAMIHIPSFMKDQFKHSNVNKGIHRHTAWRSHNQVGKRYED
jgi:hypothetical protein